MSRLRMEPRRKIKTFTPVYDVRKKALLGYLGDLTLKGALMVSETPVEVGRILNMTVEFRDNPDAPLVVRMTISARVAWCKLEEHRTYYNVGLEFLEVTERNKQAIVAILDKYEITRKRPKLGKG